MSEYRDSSGTIWSNPPKVKSRKEYEDDLARRQREHLDQVHGQNWQPCMHDACTECVGTGVKRDGTPCVHMLSCPCPKCSPYC